MTGFLFPRPTQFQGSNPAVLSLNRVGVPKPIMPTPNLIRDAFVSLAASLRLGTLRDLTSEVGSHSIRDHLIRRRLHMMTTYEPQDLLVEPVWDENFDVPVGEPFEILTTERPIRVVGTLVPE